MRDFYLIFLISLFLSLILSPLLRWLGLKIGAYIKRKRLRDLHQGQVPRLGGLAIFLSFVITTLVFLEFNKHLEGILLASILIFGANLFDDIFQISWPVKLASQIATSLIIIGFGIGIDFFQTPWGLVYLDQVKIPLTVLGTTYHLILWSDLFTLVWLVLLMNSLNFLDGLDGLAGGISVIGFGVIFFLSLRPEVNQLFTAFLALVMMAAVLGFLPFNFSRRKLFLGDSGAYFLGFMLAVLAIVSGAKVATALLVLGVPIFDALWVVINRLINKKSPFLAGLEHLHHRLLKRGLSKIQILFLFYSVSLVFGMTALYLKSLGKLITLIILFLLMGGFSIFLALKEKHGNA